MQFPPTPAAAFGFSPLELQKLHLRCSAVSRSFVTAVDGLKTSVVAVTERLAACSGIGFKD